MSDVPGFIENNRQRFIEELKELLRFPSISTDPDRKDDINRCAEYIREHLDNIGMKNSRVLPTKGHPIVFSEWLGAGSNKPTVLIYGHYDVQPVDPLELWTAPPFEPEIRDGNLFARGAADDKGQFFLHIKAIESHLKNNGKLPVNVKLLIEGEEEIGSINLEEFLEENKDMLKADVIVISDTAMLDRGVPSIGYALRGLCYMQLEVTGPNRDLHSGSYGGGVDNPINALAHIIAKLKDDKGRILMDGFYDNVRGLTDTEKENMKKLPFDENEFRKGVDVENLFGEEGYSTLERLWTRPTLDCNGIWGGFMGEGAKTVLPSKAYAKISMRLVPDQQPDEIAQLFEDYVNKIAPESVRVKVQGLHHGKPAITPIDSKWVKAAFNALQKGFGVEPVFIREGGSIPIVVTFKEVLGLDTILLGFGLPDENAHSPDEHFDLENFHKGIITSSYLYEELAKLK
jgi:acetylornithine deacetylase/succinyl-diaminopimelate desuccinylase-like protein